MRIHKLTASFGRLENETLSFHEGLNVICAPNESGKSTWCAFIRAMLYGVDSAERSRAGYLPDKTRYAPWSGAPMEGTMELTADRCDITITRRTKARNAPMREFSAVYTGTNVPVEGMTGANAGEMLTGVSKDVFNRSAFVAQGAAAVSGSPELERRINAIVSTGEEAGSYSEADERLRAWQRKRRYNKKGLLPELEARIDETEGRLEELDRTAKDIRLLEGQLEKARQDCAALEQAVTDSRKKQRRESLDKLTAGRAELKRRDEAHEAALAQLNRRREELRAHPLGDQPRRELEAEVEADLSALASLEQEKPRRSPLLLAVLCFILAVAFAAAYTAWESVVLIVFAAVFCLAAIGLLLRGSKLRQSLRDAEERRSEILRKYRASGPGEISALMEQYLPLSDRALQALQEEQATREAYEQAREQLARLEEEALEALDFAGGSSEAARCGKELTEARRAAERISAHLSALRGKRSAGGDPALLAGSLSRMREEHALLSAEYEQIGLAIQVLREADGEIQSRFSPELGRLAARYMASVTDGRYEDVFLNRDFSARTRAKGDAVAREAEYLSAGTLDLMYLAVRLAVCELALPEGEPCPLIIDDALVNLDATRYEQALALLRQVAKERQVILFTCRK